MNIVKNKSKIFPHYRRCPSSRLKYGKQIYAARQVLALLTKSKRRYF